MSTQLLLTCLLIADVILCVAIVILIVIVNREVKKRRSGLDEEALREFRKLLDESQSSTNHLLEVMNESRKSLKEIAYALDQKEGTLRTLIEESRIECEKIRKNAPPIEGAALKGKNEEVLSMAAQGFSKKEISQRLSMTEGEIELIIDLDRTRHRSHHENV
jgi:DNA-directed RNA polymerase specialized sigma24 family protein